MLAGDYEFTFNPDTPSLKVLRATKKSEFKRQPPTEPCISWDGGPVTVSLKGSGPTAPGCGMPTRNKKPWSHRAS